MAELWVEPDYYDAFRCKCGSCRSCCCSGWDIAVGMQEYFRLIGMDCSVEMHHHLECAFHVPEEPSEEHFRVISSNWMGECPMRDADGLCMLQKECGEDALPEICRMYPRSLRRLGDHRRASCSNSCEAVTELLMRPEPLIFSAVERSDRPEIELPADDPVEHRWEIVLKLLQDRSLALNLRIGRICGIYANAAAPILDSGRLEPGLRSLMSMLEEMREESGSLQRFGSGMFARYASKNPLAMQNYSVDARRFEAQFPDWMGWFENLLANHLFYMAAPQVDDRLKASEICAGICAAYGVMRLACAACAANGGTRTEMADALAGMFRLIEHSSFYYNAHILISSSADLLAL